MAKVGGVPARKISIARNRAVDLCHRSFDRPPEQRACRIGTEHMVSALAEQKEVEMSGVRKGMKGGSPVMKLSSSLGGGVGFFRNCADKCPPGTERVTIKKDKRGEPAICICRLGPGHRKKMRDESVRVTPEYERGLRPFGKESSPIHLRRCVEVDEKGRCVDEGEPVLRVTPIERKRR